MNILLIALAILIVPSVIAIIALNIIPFRKTENDSKADGYVRKFENADLKKSRFLFLSLGLLVSFGMSSYVLNYEFEDEEQTAVLKKKVPIDDVVYEEIVNTEQPDPPPPEDIKPPVVEELIPEEVVEVEKKKEEEKKEEDPEPEFNDDDFKLPTTGTGTAEKISDEPVFYAEVEPEFPGGKKALEAFINKETNKRMTRHDKEKYKNLPPGANVKVSYIIEKDGSISDVKVIKAVHYQSINDAIVASFSNLPKWKPAETSGYKVRLRYVQTIKLK